MFRSHNFNLKSISNLWSLRLGAFFQKAHCLYSSSMPRYLKTVPQIITIVLSLFISTLSSSPRVPIPCCFPPHADVNPVLFLSVCTWSPLSSAGTGCAFCAPGARREHQIGLLKGSSPMLSPACVFSAVRVIFHLCLIFLQQKCNGAWTYKNILAPDILKYFVGKKTVSHSTLLITFFLLKAPP